MCERLSRPRNVTDQAPPSRVRPIDLPLLYYLARRQRVRPQVMIKSEGCRIHLGRGEPHLPWPVQRLLPVNDDGAVLEKNGDKRVVQALAATIRLVRIGHDSHIGRRDLLAQRCLEAAWSLWVSEVATTLTQACKSQRRRHQAAIPFVHVPFTNMYSSSWWLTS